MAVFLTKTFVLDVEPGALPPILKVKQYDGDGTRQYIVTFTKNDSPYDIPSEATKFVCQGSKPDGTGFSYIATKSGNSVIFNLYRQMTTVFGEIKCDIVFYDSSENQLSSQTFLLLVERAAVQLDQIKSQDEFTTLISYVNAAEEYKNWAKSYAIGGTGLRSDEETNNSNYNWKLSKSYAIGNSGVRIGENTDNSKYYCEEVKDDRYQIDLNKTEIQGLQAQIDQFIDPPLENVGEVVNARVGFDGTVYPTLGDAIRTQMTKFAYIAANEEIYFSNNS